jgi:hypothetical protein
MSWIYTIVIGIGIVQILILIVALIAWIRSYERSKETI